MMHFMGINKVLMLGVALNLLGFAWNFAFGTWIRHWKRYRDVSTTHLVWIGQIGLVILVAASWIILQGYFDSVRRSFHHHHH